MTGVEHVHLHVADIESATSFYTETMGLVEHERTSEGAFLGCGLGAPYDLLVSEGGTGLDHVAIRQPPAEVRDCIRRLDERDVPATPVDHDDDRLGEGVRVTLPSGVDLEVVARDPSRYAHAVDTADPDRSGIAPRGLDHVNVASTAVRADATFLTETLGFSLTEAQEADAGGVDDADDAAEWLLAFTRSDHTHHTVALTRSDDPADTCKHVAWSMASLEHMKLFVDAIAAAGTELEVGISRHRAGNNLFAYFWEPGGNRFEITTEMATVEPGAPPLLRDPDDSTFTSWGGVPFPDSLRDAT